MFYNLNTFEKNVKVGGKEYFLGKVSLKRVKEIIESERDYIRTEDLRKFWIPVIHETLEPLNDAYTKCSDTEISNEEIINFITAFKG